MMIDRDKVMKGLEGIYRCISPVSHTCGDCPYQDNHVECIRRVVSDAQELIESLEATRPTTSVQPGTTYQRLMAIKVELEDKNHALTTEVRELRRLNESLSNLCHNLLRRLAKYE